MLRYLILFMLLVPVQSFALTTGQNATLVIGNSDFNSGGTIPGEPAANTIHSPDGIAFDKDGNLWVADTGFNRILRFTPPFTNDQNATGVLGQENFHATNAILSKNGLDQPYEIAFDKDGNMWVSDTNDNRVLEYKYPFTNDESASLVIGSPHSNKGVYPTSANSLAAPSGLAFDSNGNLWVVDYHDNRILEYVPPFKDRMNATLVIGQYDFQSNSDGTSKNRLNHPSNIAFDDKGNLWVTDSLNNRVLEFSYPFSNDESASMVIGQKDFTNNINGIENDSFSTPYGITFDSSGNLWVADGSNARVLEFSPPFKNGMSASVVIGQQTFSGMHMGTSANMLAEPYDVKIDASGNLWVADTQNNRVLEFSGTPAPEFGPVTSLVFLIGISTMIFLMVLTRSRLSIFTKSNV